MDEYLTTADAAKLAMMNTEYIRQLTRAGKVASQKFGNTIMIDHASLKSYLATDRSQTARALKVSQARAKTKGKAKAKK